MNTKRLSIALVCLVMAIATNCTEENLKLSPSQAQRVAELAGTTSAATLAATYNVGPTRTYKKLQDVASLLQPGDVVLVDGDATYPGDVFFTKDGTASNRIIIRGVKQNGKRPIISGGRNGIEISSHYTTFEGFEISGSTKSGIFHHADQVEIRDCIIHDCRNGLLGYGSGSGNLLFEYNEIYNCGSEPTSTANTAHGIYMATDELAFPNAVFRMQYCYVHHGTGGNNVKTRSGRNEIYYNWIEGATHHGLELIGPDPEDNGDVSEDTKREDSDVVGNVLLVTVGGSGARIGGDGTGQSKGRYRFVNNTFILNGRGDAIRTYDALQTLEMYNNVFYNKASASNTEIFDDAVITWVSGRQIKGSNNWIQTGSTKIPGEFTGTITGTNPGFVDVTSNNLNLTATSPLINVGTSTPTTIASYPFPNPLFPPTYHPPLHSFQVPGTAVVRPTNGAIDIGAYEYGSSVPNCSATVSPASASYAAIGGTGSIAVTINTSCTWSATSNTTWINITSGPNGTGNGTVNYTVTQNTGTPRTGTITVAGQNFTVNQAGQTTPGGSLVDYYTNETQPTVTFTGGAGTAIVTTEGVGGSNGIKFAGLAQWTKTKRIHFAVAKDISSVSSTDKLRISIDMAPGTPSTYLLVNFNNRWDVYVRTPVIDNIAGYQTFDLDLSSVRGLLGNTVNDIYFAAGDGFPTGATLKVDEIKFIRP